MFGKKRRIPTYNLQPKPLQRSRGQGSVLSGVRSRQFEMSKRRNTSIFGRLKKLFTLLFIVGFIAFCIYLFFFSNFFNIREIVVSNKNFENQAISDQIKEDLKANVGRNIFMINTIELETKVLNIFPQLEKIRISKNFPRSLNIEFSEFPLAANVVNESNVVKKSYIINSIGFAIKENLEDPKLPYIKIKTDEPINPKEAVIEKNKLNYLLDAKNYFEDKFGMKIIATQYKPIPREIRFYTDKGFYIWLDIQKPFEDQFKKLKKAIVKLDIYKENLEYIDLRIAGSSGDKIIYKRR